MEADGHRVRLAYDGEQAVDAFRQDLPDLTILDLNMPVKDGEQVLVEVRALDVDLPILVLTARQEVDTRVRCLDLGADDLMLKPFSLHELRARCRALLQAQARGPAAAPGRRPGAGPAGPHGAPRQPVGAAHQQGVRAARAPDAQPRPVRLPGGAAGCGLEHGTGADDQHRGRLCELFASQVERPAARPVIRTVRGQGYVVPAEAGQALGVAATLPPLPARPAIASPIPGVA